MTRTALTLSLVAGLSVWASAQSQPARHTADHLRLLETNLTLLERLTDRGLEISNAGNPLERAEGCRKAAATLGAELRQAADDPTTDPDRVVELSEHLTTLVRDGLAPTLAKARDEIRPGSPEYDRLKKVHADAKAELERTRQAFPTDGKVGRSRRVKAAQDKLTDVAKQIELKEKDE
jgi:hypothetical protein